MATYSHGGADSGGGRANKDEASHWVGSVGQTLLTIDGGPSALDVRLVLVDEQVAVGVVDAVRAGGPELVPPDRGGGL